MESVGEKKFFVFRFADTVTLQESHIMEMEIPKAPVVEAIGPCIEAGYGDGSSSRVIFSGYGISVVHVWFKRFFPLPLHAHNADCVYYIIGGSLRLGTQDLAAGDGFFVGADVPYTYRPGPDGVELLEIRNRDQFDYRDKSSPAFWKKALDTVSENRAAWANSSRLFPVST